MKKVKRLHTVNVIETNDGVPNNIVSYPDNKGGNKEAESLFGKIAMENGAIKEDVINYIEDGYYEKGTYTVYLTHSN